MKGKVLIAAVSIAALILVFSLQGCLQNNQNPGGGGANTVDIKNFAFNPESLTISKGTTVTWTNNDNVDHTVTSQSGPTSFDSGNIKPGASYSYTFNDAGNYTYICTIHPYMFGNVTVQ